VKIIIANSIGIGDQGQHIVHFPSRWTASVGSRKAFTYYPYELAYLSALLKRDTAHDVRFVDGNFLQLDAARYADLLCGLAPEWLVMEPATMTYPQDLRVALAVKKACATKVVFCGPHATVFPKETLADGVDYVCTGEYEDTVLSLVRGADPGSLPGVYPVPRAGLLDLDILPFPEDEDISRWDYTGIWGSDYREIEMFASRGCRMSCVFCVCRHVYYGCPNWRARRVESVIEEIRYLKNKYPAMEGVFFDEEDHNAEKSFVLALTAAIRKNGLDGLKYNAMCGYWTLDREMIEAMAGAGYYKLRIGIETASLVVAKAMQKPIDIPRLKAVLKIARSAGMKMYGTFTVGAPGSTRREDLKTVRLVKELLDGQLLQDLQISICTPQPGTPFYRYVVDNGYLIDGEWNDFDGGVRGVVDYPGYPHTRIEELLRLGRRVTNYAFESRCRGERLLLKEMKYLCAGIRLRCRLWGV